MLSLWIGRWRRRSSRAQAGRWQGQSPAGIAYSTLTELRADRAAQAERWQQQAEQQAAWRQSPAATLAGDCPCCGQRTAFSLRTADHVGDLDLREGLVCANCRLNARQRAAFSLLREVVADPQAQVYLTEQASPSYVWAKHHYPHAIGSEFAVATEKRPALEDWLRRQGVAEAIRDADVTALPFADARFDAIVSFDVLEHVPDYPRALAEFARCLRPQGWLVLTIPFLEDDQATRVRARIDDRGDIEHLLPPEIHGDPLSGGVLCYYHFGWDLLDALRTAGFSDARWHRHWAPAQGLLGPWTLMARR